MTADVVAITVLVWLVVFAFVLIAAGAPIKEEQS